MEGYGFSLRRTTDHLWRSWGWDWGQSGDRN